MDQQTKKLWKMFHDLHPSYNIVSMFQEKTRKEDSLSMMIA